MNNYDKSRLANFGRRTAETTAMSLGLTACRFLLSKFRSSQNEQIVEDFAQVEASHKMNRERQFMASQMAKNIDNWFNQAGDAKKLLVEFNYEVDRLVYSHQNSMQDSLDAFSRGPEQAQAGTHTVIERFRRSKDPNKPYNQEIDTAPPFYKIYQFGPLERGEAGFHRNLDFTTLIPGSVDRAISIYSYDRVNDHVDQLTLEGATRLSPESYCDRLKLLGKVDEANEAAHLSDSLASLESVVKTSTQSP